MLEKFLEVLGRSKWPLLLIGLFIILLGTTLFTVNDIDRSDARSLLLGVGSILLGAGIVRLIYLDKEIQQLGCKYDGESSSGQSGDDSVSQDG
jgi:uncharacterized membrane protein YqgA involved in biofilm formation